MKDRLIRCPWHEKTPDLKPDQVDLRICMPCATLIRADLHRRQGQRLVQKLIAYPTIVNRMISDSLIQLRGNPNDR